MQIFTVSTENDKKPLLQVISATFPHCSPHRLNRAFLSKDIRLDGKVANATQIVNQGQSVRVFINDADLLGFPQIPILYEDDCIWVVEKPIGLPVASIDSPHQMTLQDALAHQTGLSPIPCHRLDVFTGGTVLFAKNNEMANLAFDWFKYNQVLREYAVIVYGHAPKQFDATHYALKDAKKALVQVYDKPMPGAKEMKLSAECIAQNHDLALLKVQLFSGRTHQIRAQMSRLDLSVLGDDKYGHRQVNKLYKIKHPLLWHTRLGLPVLPSPFDHLSRLCVSSPPKFPEKVACLFDLSNFL